MKPPQVPEGTAAGSVGGQAQAAPPTCERGSGFEDRRDAALIRVFIDTGARRAEVANLR